MSIATTHRKFSRATTADESPAALLASFPTASALLQAVRQLRNHGFRNLDAHSPHPIHGLDDALRVRTRSLLPLGAAIGAATGLAGGLWMAWWMNAVDYPFIISGKPLFSLLPSLPVAFELAILLAAFAVFGGTLLLGGLPAFANPRFRIPAFARATNDLYFVEVSAAEARFAETQIRDILEQSGAISIDPVVPPSRSEARVPQAIKLSAVALTVLALVPAALIAKARFTTSEKPRISLISDMDHQPKFKSQTTSTLFADQRATRPQVPGTIPRGDLREDSALYLGIRPIATTDTAVTDTAMTDTGATDTGATQVSGRKAQGESGPDRTGVQTGFDVAPENVVAEPDWITQFPLSVDERLIRRGQQRYNIFCATCHGLGGDGDGLVTQRALELEQGTWIKPTSLHSDAIRTQPVGRIYNTIANGIRKMPGYASQIPVEDRWAIVAYLRALQRTRTATVQDVPSDIRPNLRELN